MCNRIYFFTKGSADDTESYYVKISVRHLYAQLRGILKYRLMLSTKAGFRQYYIQ